MKVRKVKQLTNKLFTSMQVIATFQAQTLSKGQQQ